MMASPAGMDMCALGTDIHGCIWWAKDGAVGNLHDGKFPCRKGVETRLPMAGGCGTMKEGTYGCVVEFQLFKLEMTPGTVHGTSAVSSRTIGGRWRTVMIDSPRLVMYGSARTFQTGLYRQGRQGFEIPFTTSPRRHFEAVIQDREGNLWAGTFGRRLENRIRAGVAIILEDTQSGPAVSLHRGSICEKVADVAIGAGTQKPRAGWRKSGDPLGLDSPKATKWAGRCHLLFTADALGRVGSGNAPERAALLGSDGNNLSGVGGRRPALRGQTNHTLLVQQVGRTLWDRNRNRGM